VASCAQESQRDVKYGGDIKFIKPSWAGKHEDAYEIWKRAVSQAAETYAEMIGFCGIPAQSARTVLPNSMATVIVVKANIREWLHIFSLFGSAAAYPQMRSLMLPMMADFHDRLPLIFDAPEGIWEAMDVSYKEGLHD
jgi:thymidylate synthase (FAD)